MNIELLKRVVDETRLGETALQVLTEHFCNGKSIPEAAEIAGVHRNVANRWRNRFNQALGEFLSQRGMSITEVTLPTKYLDALETFCQLHGGFILSNKLNN